jgi:hypothetical protein
VRRVREDSRGDDASEVVREVVRRVEAVLGAASLLSTLVGPGFTQRRALQQEHYSTRTVDARFFQHV